MAARTVHSLRRRVSDVATARYSEQWQRLTLKDIGAGNVALLNLEKSEPDASGCGRQPAAQRGVRDARKACSFCCFVFFP